MVGAIARRLGWGFVIIDTSVFLQEGLANVAGQISQARRRPHAQGERGATAVAAQGERGATAVAAALLQILPYEEKNYQVYKIFPNKLDDKNFVDVDNLTIPKKGKFQIYFPENLNKKNVDEYLFIIGSEKEINWLDKYTKFEDLKNAYIKEKFIIYKYKGYTIYR